MGPHQPLRHLSHRHDALRRWYSARPTASTDALFVKPAPPQVGDAIGDIVTKHATAVRVRVREDRRTAHARRHTFCTMLGEHGIALEVIRALVGHVDVRTTQIYVDVTDQRKAEGIAALERTRHPLAVAVEPPAPPHGQCESGGSCRSSAAR